MAKLLLVLAAALASIAHGINNGGGVTPPMGWRSWNLFGFGINQTLMEGIVEAMTVARPIWDGTSKSLLNLGYNNVGIDDGWQLRGSYGPQDLHFHLPNGAPVVDKTLFPDMQALVNYANSLGMGMGFYGNNCGDAEVIATPEMYLGDSTYLITIGFSGYKLDYCGAQKNYTLWAELLNSSYYGPIIIEACEWGDAPANATSADFHLYRTSGDVQSKYNSILNNLNTVAQFAKSQLSGYFQNPEVGVAWAYPDMLEVGINQFVNHPGSGEYQLPFNEARVHFAAWAIVSSPLTLSHDPTNETINEIYWPIISNTEVIAVNQAWAGFSGSYWRVANTTVSIFGDTFPTAYYYYKPVSSSQMAVMVINNDDQTDTLSFNFNEIPGVPCTSNCSVRDLYNHVELGYFSNSYSASIPSRDSIFLMLSA